MSDPFNTRPKYNSLCRGKLIKGREELKCVVDPRQQNAKIIFNVLQLEQHCEQCDKTKDCTEECKQNIANVFKTKKQPTNTHISQTSAYKNAIIKAKKH